MRMKRFRVENYKKIEDTGWVKTGKFTAFVGKNESGKSSIFRGLSKLNPSDGVKYNKFEFPRSRYTSEFKKTNWPVSSAEFELEEDDKLKINGLGIPIKINAVTVTRYYDYKYSMSFEPSIEYYQLSNIKYVEELNKWKDNIEKSVLENKGDELANLKTSLINIINNTIDIAKSAHYVVYETVSTFSTNINSQLNETWQKSLFSKIIDENKLLEEKLENSKKIDVLKNWILENMPKFIYFDRYDVLDSAIHIDEFIRKLAERPDDPKIRITKCLFDHVDLDIEKIKTLDVTNSAKTIEELKVMATERSIDMDSASQAMTEKFSQWWDQRKHVFHYDIDGKNFRVWVSDDLEPSRIELDQRSAGLQYFFSFYLVFLVEANRNHGNSILLLDEPGLHFHGTAQEKTVDLMKKISDDNQLLYTTHSPFMLDGDHLEDIKIVYEDKNDRGVTKISDNIWPKDKDAIYPLQAALGYSIAQTLFHSMHQLIVEGISDYMILKSMNELLHSKSLTTLNEKITITPAGGTKHIMPLAALLNHGKMKMITLLDGDQPGTSKQKELKKELLIDSLIIDYFTEKNESEIEDMFDDIYIDVVKQVYTQVEFDFDDAEQKISPIINKIEKLFERKSLGKFEKWNVNKKLVDLIQNSESNSKISDPVCKKFEKLFKEINSKLV